MRAVLVPGWDRDAGPALVEGVRAAKPDMPVIVLADAEQLDLAVDAMRAGASDFLINPVASERLLEALNAHRDRRRPIGELAPLAEKLAPDLSLEELIGADNMRQVEKWLLLESIDSHWREHLTAIDDMRTSIGLQAYAQIDPLVAFKKEGFDMFRQLQENIRRQVARTIFKVRIQQQAPPPPVSVSTATSSGSSSSSAAESTTGSFQQQPVAAASADQPSPAAPAPSSPPPVEPTSSTTASPTSCTCCCRCGPPSSGCPSRRSAC